MSYFSLIQTHIISNCFSILDDKELCKLYNIKTKSNKEEEVEKEKENKIPELLNYIIRLASRKPELRKMANINGLILDEAMSFNDELRKLNYETHLNSLVQLLPHVKKADKITNQIQNFFKQFNVNNETTDEPVSSIFKMSEISQEERQEIADLLNNKN